MTKTAFSSPHGDLSIREARTDDAAHACDIVRSSIVELCFPDHGGDRGNLAVWLANKTPDNFRAWIAQSHVFVAERDGRMVGVAALAATGEITLNYVLPQQRYTGVSRALLLGIEERARDLGMEACRLDSTRTALSFYRSAGYDDVAEDSRGPRLFKRL